MFCTGLTCPMVFGEQQGRATMILATSRRQNGFVRAYRKLQPQFFWSRYKVEGPSASDAIA